MHASRFGSTRHAQSYQCDLQAVLERANWLRATEKVKAKLRNRKRPTPRSPHSDGINRLTWERIRRVALDQNDRTRQLLLSGQYVPSSAARKLVLPSGRSVWVHSVLDRVIQVAILQVLQPVVDPTLSDSSYGFRPGRNCHQALCRLLVSLRSNPDAVVLRVDLQECFGSINVDRAMHLMSRYDLEPALARIILRMVRRGILRADRWDRCQGLCTGAPLSPLICNVVLDVFDRWLETRGIRFVRFADDAAMVLPSEEEARRTLSDVRQCLWQKLKLALNDKTVIAKPGGGIDSTGSYMPLEFLAHAIGKDLSLSIPQAKMDHHRATVGPLLRQRALRAFLPKAMGFVNYYRLCGADQLNELDSWVTSEANGKVNPGYRLHHSRRRKEVIRQSISR